MAVTQNELTTALATFLATNPVRLAMRSGLSTELDLADLVVGEIALATDTLQVWICTSTGTVIPLTGLTILGYYSNAGALAAAHPTGTAGQIYAVGSAPTHTYTWGGAAWVDMGAMNDVSTFATQAQLNGKVSTTGDETIAGVKTLSSSPIVPTPTTDMQSSTKKYVDDTAGAVATETYKKVDAAGDLLYGTGADALARLALGLAGKTLQVNAGATAPEWIFPFKVGNTTRDLTAASGSVAITGVGFKPSSIILFGALDGTGVMSIAVYDGTSTYGLYSDYAKVFYGSPNASFVQASGAYQVVTVSALGADGFTLSWTKTGSPTGTLKLGYLCMR